MKLEVGMYVRIKNGIGKIVAKYVKGVLINKGGCGYYRTENVDILKSSHNITDLIEAGDYVNGLQVIEVREHLHNDIEIILTNGSFSWSFSKNESDYKIKSIVTHEQMESMSYKVEG